MVQPAVEEESGESRVWDPCHRRCQKLSLVFRAGL